MKPDEVAHFSDNVHLLGLFSFHPSGWVREAALVELEKFDDGNELSYLLIRANDWVVPIRNRSWSAIRRRLPTASAEVLVSNIGVIGRLADKTRLDMTGLLSDIHGALAARQESIEIAISSEDFRIRRAGYDIAWKLEEERRVKFIRRGLNDLDSLIRLRSATQAAACTDHEVRAELSSLLLSDSWYAVRMKGLYMIIADNSDQTEFILRKLIHDGARTVREAARFYLRASGINNFAQAYRDCLIRREDLVTDLLGIGECGSVSDAKLVKPYCAHETSRVASAALTAYAKLTPDEADEVLLRNLGNRYPSVSNTSRKLLLGRVSGDFAEQVAEIYQDRALEEHIRLNALKLLMEQGKWIKLIHLLRGVADTSPRIRAYSEHNLDRWRLRYNQSFTQPSEWQVSEITKIVTQLPIRGTSISRFLRSVLHEH